MRLWLGIVTFVAGATLWRVAHRDRAIVPAKFARLGLGVGALGLGTLANTQPGLSWSISSIAFGLVAIILLGTFLLDMLRRGR